MVISCLVVAALPHWGSTIIQTNLAFLLVVFADILIFVKVDSKDPHTDEEIVVFAVEYLTLVIFIVIVLIIAVISFRKRFKWGMLVIMIINSICIFSFLMAVIVAPKNSPSSKSLVSALSPMNSFDTKRKLEDYLSCCGYRTELHLIVDLSSSCRGNINSCCQMSLKTLYPGYWHRDIFFISLVIVCQVFSLIASTFKFIHYWHVDSQKNEDNTEDKPKSKKDKDLEKK